MISAGISDTLPPDGKKSQLAETLTCFDTDATMTLTPITAAASMDSVASRVGHTIGTILSVERRMGEASRVLVDTVQVYVLAWWSRMLVFRMKQLLVAAKRRSREEVAAQIDEGERGRFARHASQLRSKIDAARANSARLRDNLDTWEKHVSKDGKRWWHGPWRHNLTHLLAAQDEVLVMLDDYTENLELAADQPVLDWLRKEIRENA